MREILFRGKRAVNEKWVYGSLLIQTGERINKDELTPDEYRILGCRGENYLVNPKTVGQYTGLKDKNNKKIFEGDVLIDVYDIDKTYIVVFDDNEAAFKMKYYKYYCEGKYECYENMVPCTYCEVIGNIFDNSLEELQNA